LKKEKYYNVSVGGDGDKLHISCHNHESLRVLLPSNISTGNVNLNKKTCPIWAGLNISKSYLDVSGIIPDSKEIAVIESLKVNKDRTNHTKIPKNSAPIL
jgi:hypothetical protein